MENMLYARIVKFLERNLAHRGCEDGWYACPKSEDYIKHHKGENLGCDCGASEAEAILKEMGFRI